MMKYLVVCLAIVAASLKTTYAVTDEEKANVHAALLPSVTECGKEFGVSLEDIKEAKQKADFSGIDPCVFACILKKAEFTKDGLFDKDSAMAKVRKYIKGEEDLKKFEEIGNSCSSVNNEKVGSEKPECDRAKLLFTCFKQKKHELFN